ncbi:DUF222 domain-containing protein [Actinomycetaceae bacterium MB13-C1-2]|nr:DUF222 domain-containing protein [Actinomycetaceae bacterium MB13-C1-2]
MTDLDVTASEVASLEGEELLRLCRCVALEMNRLQKLQTQIAKQIWSMSEGSLSQDSLTKQYGCRSSVELVQRLTGEPARVVSARIRLGRQTAVRVSLLGEELPPLQEHVASALESGYLNVDSAGHISRLIAEKVRPSNVDDLDFAERSLVQAATGFDFGAGDAPGMALHADDIRRLCLKWDEALDPDGTAPDDDLRLRGRFLNVGPTRDGLSKVTGLLTAETAAAFGVVLDSLNNPRAKADGRVTSAEAYEATVRDSSSIGGAYLPDTETETDPEVDAGVDVLDSGLASEADPTDDRTAGQRRHDALATALNVALSSRDLPVLQGANAMIVVEVREESLARHFGWQYMEGGIDGSDSAPGRLGTRPDSGPGSVFESDHQSCWGPAPADNLRVGSGSVSPAWLIGHDGAPTPLSMNTVSGLTCGAVIQAVVRDSLGRITQLGSPARIFSATQRRAIALRDGGCVIPGCTVPASWCEVHHVMPHAFGGPTHTDNGVLLCRFHHSTIDSNGWEIKMNHGVPLVRPPNWLKSLYPDDPRREWMNQVLADQAIRIREKLEARKKQRVRNNGVGPGSGGSGFVNRNVVDTDLVHGIADIAVVEARGPAVVDTLSIRPDVVAAHFSDADCVTSGDVGAGVVDSGIADADFLNSGDENLSLVAA